MTAPAVVWPSSRHVLGWWAELASLRPLRLWLCHLHLHHIEALVAAPRPCRLYPLPAALLRFLEQPDTSAGELAKRLQLDEALVHQLLAGLASEGFIDSGSGRPTLTAAARQALREGTIAGASRRAVHFLDRTELGLPPHFLPLRNANPTPFVPDAHWSFDSQLLQDCVRQPGAWKERFGFPADIEAILMQGATPANGTPDWQHVVVDRAEALTMLAAEVTAGDKAGTESHLVGFAVTVPDWILARAHVVLELGASWPEVLPNLAAGAALEEWRKAWRQWCQPRGVPASETDACRVDLAGAVLHVHAPRRLVDRLRAARSDAVKNEAWLLAGTGRTRAVARVELHT